MSTYTRFTQSNRRLERLFGSVYLSIPEATANKILGDYKNSIDEGAYYICEHQLRNALQAVKFSTNEDGVGSEVQVLQNLRAVNSPNLVRLLSADTNPSQDWLVLEVLSGGTVEQFSKLLSMYGITPDIGLAWHMISQMAVALLALHFGYKMNGVVASATRYSHNDIHEGNVMFRGRRAFMDYPEMVLVDFGHATGIDDVAPLEFRKKQANDVAKTGYILNEILGGMARSHTRLSDELDRMMCFSAHHGSTEQADRHLREFLIQLRDRSLRNRWEDYHELPARVLAHFEKQLVDLEKGFPSLA